MIEIKEICTNLSLDINKVLNIYLFGSRLYGTNEIDSDFDYIIIYEQEEKRKEHHNPELKINCELYSLDGFKEDLQNHKIHILECLYSDEQFKFETIHFEIKINLEQLRISISSTCSNSYDKARKKISINSIENIYIGQKSLFHCFRILYYGIQIVKYKKIIDFSGENFSKEYKSGINFLNEYKNLKELLEEIKGIYDWNVLKNKYNDILSILRENFRKICPMVSKRITPQSIISLKKNEIYVFGANTKFINGKGSALYSSRFGSQYYKGPFCGQTYGICTKDDNIKTLPLDKINIYIKEFIEFTTKNNNLIFFVVEIGCLNAGYSAKDIAPMFKDVIALENVYLPKSFWEILL